MGPSIWELMHRECGTWDSYGLPYLEKFLAGKIDFDEFCRMDVACWKGRSSEELAHAISKITYRPGFPELMQALHKRNIATAIISGTVGQFAEHLAKTYRIEHVFANPVDLNQGTIELKVPGHSKGIIIEKLLYELGLNRHEVAVAGDSHFDLAMFEHAEHSFIIENEKYQEHSKYFVQDFFEILAKL
jgi:phosphoserine phosphatase